MFVLVTAVIFLELLASAQSSQLGCPIGCICDYKEYIMSCSNGNLAGFPMYMVWCPEVLTIENNTIPVMKNGSLTPCGDTIITLSLRNSGIEIIEDGVFDDFSKLKTLDLRDNKVKAFGEYLFKGLSDIDVIHFENNSIQTINHGEQKYGLTSSGKATLHLNNNKLKTLDAGLPKGFNVMYLDNNEIVKIAPDAAIYPLIGLNKLSLKGNKIKTITRRAFLGLTNATWFRNEDSPLTNLLYIVLDDNSIEHIEPYAFEGLSAINELNISRNNLNTLGKHAFCSLTGLNKLFLIKSNIKVIEPEAFRDLDSLVELNLSGNLIEELSDNIFLDLPRLETLILVSNKIKNVRKEIFNGLAEMKFMNLSYNDLKALKKASFKGLDKLEILDLSHNHIRTTEIDTFQNLTGLDKLILDHNEIEKLQPLAFRDIPNLRELSFKHNHITTISPKLDEQLNILRTDLYLRGNTVEIPEPKEVMSLEKLVVLDFSHNKLHDLPPGVFREASRIFSLRLNNNRFTFLRSRALKGLRRIYELNLHHNPIHCDCMMVNTWLFSTINHIDTTLSEDHDVRCKTPYKDQDKEWHVLKRYTNSTGCRPLTPLPSQNQAGLFVLGPVVLIIVGSIAFIINRIIRRLIVRYCH